MAVCHSSHTIKALTYSLLKGGLVLKIP